LTPDDPFGRRGEERTDAFGRPIDEREEAPRAAPPTPPPSQPAPGGFAPPTDNPPEQAAWWTDVQPGTIEGRAHPDGTAPLPSGVVAAEWPARAGAAAIDFLVRAGIILAATFLGAIGGETGATIGFFVGVLGGYVYSVWMIAARDGQTVGHKVANTRIVRANGRPLDGGGAFVREALVKGILFDGILIWVTLGVAPLLNYLWPLWDDKNEALHDKMCGTRVVNA
jgi:uncharacterized RDD family membrane protein YckC